MDSFTWRTNYIRTFLEMDLPSLGFNVAPQQLDRFWMMLTSYHGQLFNASELGRSLDLSDHTMRKYLDILEGTLMIRTLQPWFANIQKRQVKMPKIYFRDSGIINAFLDLSTRTTMDRHARLGTLWEGFALTDLGLHRLIVIYPGKVDYSLSDHIHVYDLGNYLEQHKKRTLATNI